MGFSPSIERDVNHGFRAQPGPQGVADPAVRNFVEKEIKPIAVQIDEQHAIPDALVRKKWARWASLGRYFPEPYQGETESWRSAIVHVIVVEEVSKAYGSSGVLISATTSSGPSIRFTPSAARNRNRNGCRR